MLSASSTVSLPRYAPDLDTWGGEAMVFAVRLLLALVGGVICYELGKAFLPEANLAPVPYGLFLALIVVAGVALGVVLGGFLGRATTRLGRRLDRASSLVTASGLLFTTIGLIAGLGIAALGGLAIRGLPVVGPYLLPLLFAVSGYLFAYL